MVTVYAPLGMLGYGFPVSSMEAALQHGFDVMAVDAGSVDPGPYYLGSGKSFTSRTMVKRDLKLIVQAGQKAKVPILVGSACGAGATPHLDWAMEILEEIVQELGIHPKIARIDAELEKEDVLQAFREGRVENFETTGQLQEGDITDCTHIVAQMGIQPFIKALEGGADIILIPEHPYDIKKVAEAVMRRQKAGKNFSILAVAEGALSTEESKMKRKEWTAKRAAAGYTTATNRIAKQVEELTGAETRICVPGHMQRGGSPSAYDRVLATQFGTYAARLVADDHFGVTVAMVNNHVTANPLVDIAGKTRGVPDDCDMLNVARSMGISLG